MIIIVAIITFLALIIAALDFFFLGKIFLKSLGIFGSVILCGIVISCCVYFGSMHDVDVLNGIITSKAQVIVPCSHSYPCNCTTDSKGNTSCSTCYRHLFDYDWDVRSTIGTFTIDRIDDQGVDEPPRFTAVKMGESASRTETILNYMKASKESLYSQKETSDEVHNFSGLLPEYPLPFDYYRINRIVTEGVNYPEANDFNQKLSYNLQKLGAEKQVNILVVVAHTNDQAYKLALEHHWRGGKKNDVVVVIGVTHYPDIDWVSGFSYANSIDNSMLFVQLRDDLKDIGNIQKVDLLTSTISKDVLGYYKRHPMHEFKYLSYDYTPTGWTLFFSILIFIMLSIGIVIGINHVYNDR